MALTRIRAKPPATNGAKPRRRIGRRREENRDYNLEGLTAGALYDLQLHGVAQGSLTAAAFNTTAKNAQDIRRLIQPWQARAMSYYDLVPEVKFAAQFMSQMLSKVRLYPARLDPDTREAEEIEEGPEVDAFARIVDRNGGRSELQRSYGKLKFLIGETYLTVSPDRDRGEVWECLSPNELRVQPGGIATRFRAPMLSADQYRIGEMAPEEYVVGNDPATIDEYGEPLGPAFVEAGLDVIVVYRLWRPHPAYTWLADCNMQSSIDLLEELVLSTYSVRAQLKSRLNNGGVLWVPDEISFTSLGNDPEEDPTSDEFQSRLDTAIMTAIGDPGTAAAFSPIVARVAAEFIGKIQHTKFNDNQGALAEISQRTEMVERFGVGAELPPELFRSKAEINHWGSWLVDEDQWKSYGHPAALEMASDFATAYLQPACRELGIADWAQIQIGIDASEVINHPDRAKDAAALYAARCISKTVYLEALGYNANDLPPESELNEMIGVAIRDGSYARYGIPAVRANIEPNAGDIESAQGGAETTVENPTTGSENEPGPPPGGPGGDESTGGPAVTASADDQATRILALADAAMQRGRELAGSRLRGMTTGRNARRCADCAERIDGLPAWDVAATIGEQRVAEMFGPVTASLVDGTGHWLATMLERNGVSRQWASELGALVEVHAGGTLYQAVPDQLPAGFAGLLGRVHLPLEQA